MSNLIVVILFAVGIVAFFALGMSLTLIFKGHHIKSEISDNEHMRERGIKCAVQESREQDASGDCGDLCGDSDCSSCGTSANR